MRWGGLGVQPSVAAVEVATSGQFAANAVAFRQLGCLWRGSLG